MKKLLLVAALALTCAGIAAPRASAQSAQFTFTPTTAMNVAPGSAITFSINLVVTTGGSIQDIAGLTYFLQQTNNTSNLIFAVVGRNTSTSPFRFGQFEDGDFSPANPDPLNSSANPGPLGSNNRELGRLTQAGNYLGSGTYFVADITLSIAPNAPAGTYTVQSVTTGGKAAVVTDSDAETFPIMPASITISVIPEPSTYALLALGGIGAGIVAYRRRRATAA